MSPPLLLSHDPAWHDWFKTEKGRLLRAMGPWTTSLDHIGATAVPGLVARPVLDIMVGVPSARDAFRSVAPLERLGFTHQVLQTDEGFHLRFQRRLPSPVDVQLVPWGSLWFIRAVALREHLKQHPDSLAALDTLKRSYAGEREYESVKLSYHREIWAREGWDRSRSA